MAVPNLTRDDARVRAELLDVDSYDIVLDLTDGGGKPSERTFRCKTTIRFTAARPGSSTFLDVLAERLHSVRVNGADVDVSGYQPEDGIVLADLAADNMVEVEADMLYTNTGEGLHRFVDPLDGQTYLYSQFETADAKRVYACFDQPDLKATFTFHATTPDDWEVVSNSAVARVDELPAGKVVHFEPTARMSPYVTALVAGPFQVFRDHHDGIDLGLYCRTSMAEYLDTEELFTVTKQGFDWFHEHFGVRYPFGDKYDQLFVPEYNAGAMENAGCVTMNEQYVFRSKVTDARYERRGLTILHEQAHMWFGDLVTMRWWDDLWLNESFAEWAACTAQAENTRWANTWTTFANFEKTWAYRQDQQPTTHPIATDAPDVQTAELNFDGITYAKGACVLKQLAAYVGREPFLTAMRDYFTEHAHGNTTLADLLRALESTSTRDLGEWSKLWLETTGISMFNADFRLDAEGRYRSFELVQTAPNDVATSNTIRPHRLAIGLYREQDGRLVRTERIELDTDGERTSVAELVGVAQPDVLLINDDDLTYCRVRLDEKSLQTLRSGGISQFAESLPRALTWLTAWDMTRDGELAARDYLAMVIAGAAQETDIGVMQSLSRQALRALEIYADPQWAPTGYAQLAAASRDALLHAEPGSDHQLAWVHTLLGSARSDEHLAFIRGLLEGTETVEGLALDADLRWALLQALVARGEYGQDEIEDEAERDRSSAGAEHAATARALLPTAEAKEEAWQRAIFGDELPNAILRHTISGFAPALHADLVRPYAERYFDEIAGVWQRRSSELAQDAVIGLFPTWSSTISTATVDSADKFLTRDDVPTALKRLISEGRSDVARALRNRQVDAAAG